LGASHELEVRWAELVNRLIPCAERVRFTASGHEASHLALRLAACFTANRRSSASSATSTAGTTVSAAGAMSHFEGGVPAGIPADLVEQTVLLPADDVARVADTLAARDDVAAVILEAVGCVVGPGAASGWLHR
jgi:glutamate-1-semialdehyde 2,1-aminomutase